MSTIDQRWRWQDREEKRLGAERVAQDQAEQRERERVLEAQRERSVQACIQKKPEHDANLRRIGKAADELRAAIQAYRGFLQALAQDNVSIGDRLNVVHVDAAIDAPLSWLLEQVAVATK